MQANDPSAGLAADRERELVAVAPLPIALLHGWRGHGAFADSRQRVANQCPLRGELVVVADVLELAAAAAVEAIVGARRLDARAGRRENRLQTSARKPPTWVEPNANTVARCRARHKPHHAVAACDAVAAGRQALDLDFDD